MANTNKPHNYVSIVGQKFGRWTVISEAGRQFGKVAVECRCDCGTVRILQAQPLKNGKSTSCGCSRGASYSLEGHSANGQKMPEYVSWVGMRQRCNNPKVTYYRYYGGSGITVCKRWDTSFANFLADMGPCPKGKNTIDRINVKLGYEPSNCRWASRSEQAKNRRWSPPSVPRMRDKAGRYK